MSEIPWFLQVAIEHALTILSWHENLMKDEVPPEYLWEDVEGLEQWWRSVEEKRRDGLPTSGGYDEDDDEPSSAGMAQNELARYVKAEG